MKSDLEISKALALAIGWSESAFRIRNGELLLQATDRHFARPFDYRDRNVIWPIAEKYDCFPHKSESLGWWLPHNPVGGFHDTPQKAIALAVIGAKK